MSVVSSLILFSSTTVFYLRESPLTNVPESGSYAAIWSTAEINVAIICSSLLVMKPLAARIIPSLGAEINPTAHKENSAIRRVMSIATLEESLASCGETVEASYEACVWADRGHSVGGAKAGPKKMSVCGV